MNYKENKLLMSKGFKDYLDNICKINNVRYQIINGSIINILKTNISYINPYRVLIDVGDYTLLILYYDDSNLFFYDRTFKITLANIIKIIKKLK